jgi:hypothetical protein
MYRIHKYPLTISSHIPSTKLPYISQVISVLLVIHPKYLTIFSDESAEKPARSERGRSVGVSLFMVLGRENAVQRKGGPVGKARRVFEEVSKLPRHKQQRILGIAEDLLAHRVQR